MNTDHFPMKINLEKTGLLSLKTSADILYLRQ